MVTGVFGPQGGCLCNILMFVCIPGGLVSGLSFTTNGPLCQCTSPPVGCAAAGPGQVPLTCLTQPRIGSVFTIGYPGAGTNHLLIGPGRSAPIDFFGGCINPQRLWVDPWFVLTSSAMPAAFTFVLPNDPMLVGFTIGCQGVYLPSCWYATEGLRVTIQP